MPRPFEKKSCKLSKTVLVSAWKQEKEGGRSKYGQDDDCDDHEKAIQRQSGLGLNAPITFFLAACQHIFFLQDISTAKVYILGVDCVHDDDNRREEE